MSILETVAGWLLKIYEASPRIMVVLAAVLAVLLFAPDRLLAPFAVARIVASYRPWIGLAFLFSACMALSYPIHATAKAIWERMKGVIFKQRIKERLACLDVDEKHMLKPYLSQNARTRYFTYDNGVVANLRLCRILFIPSTRYNVLHTPHTIHEWVWDYLHEHPNLLQ